MHIVSYIILLHSLPSYKLFFIFFYYAKNSLSASSEFGKTQRIVKIVLNKLQKCVSQKNKRLHMTKPFACSIHGPFGPFKQLTDAAAQRLCLRGTGGAGRFDPLGGGRLRILQRLQIHA